MFFFLLFQVVAEPSLTKSGVYWSWNKDSASFENQLSQEASDAEKARKLWEVSEKLVGLAWINEGNKSWFACGIGFGIKLSRVGAVRLVNSLSFL